MRAPAACLALLVVAGCGDGAAPAPSAAAPAAPRVHRDAVDALSVPVPAGWRVAREPLTPLLADPAEVLSMGTGRLVSGGARCAHMPEAALRALGPRDVLVTVFERRRPGPGAATRARPFRLGRADQSEAAACAGGALRARTWWRAFRDAGRGFYVLAAAGRQAGPARQSQLRAVLDGLRFAPRREARFDLRDLRLRGTLPPGWRLAERGTPPGVLLAAGTWPAGGGAVCGRRPVPRDGAYVLLVEVPGAPMGRYPPRGDGLTLSRRRRAGDCFGPAHLVRFRAAGRAFVAYVHAPDGAWRRRAEAVDLVRDLRVAP